MIRTSQKFEFCASHRLHNPDLSDEENRRIFGKCNNPRGHGHNYELQVTLIGAPDSTGRLVPTTEFERIVSETIIEKFDHKNLNCELDEFKSVNPSVENIARVIYQMLQPRFSGHSQVGWQPSPSGKRPKHFANIAKMTVVGPLTPSNRFHRCRFCTMDLRLLRKSKTISETFSTALYYYW